MVWESRLGMTNSLGTCPTLLPSCHIRHALTGVAVSLGVKLIMLVMRHKSRAGCGMYCMDARLRGQVRRSRGVLLRTTGEGGEHIRGRNRAWRLMMWRS